VSRARTRYSCRECGASFPKWAGQCADCGAWNTLEESYAGDAAAAIRPLAEVELGHTRRSTTGLPELDRVLGGGLVQGSVVLIGGDPGIGKSTLLIQALASLSERMPALYVSGEESAEQIGMRARRLGLPAEKLRLLTETCVERTLTLALQERPAVMVMDSIQTFYSEQLQSAPGSVAQVRESAAQLVRFAKQTGTSLFLVGHVTKEGALAGPRVLEHMVDTVLYFEGEAGSQVRLVRAIKNRFGAVNELGVFAPWAIRAGWRWGWNRTAWPCCWQFCTAMAASACSIRTCSSTWWAACASPRPPPTCRYCWRCSPASATGPCRRDWRPSAKWGWQGRSGCRKPTGRARQ